MASLETTLYSNPDDNTDYYVVYHIGSDPRFIDNHMRNGLYKNGIISDPLIIYQILQLPGYAIKN